MLPANATHFGTTGRRPLQLRRAGCNAKERAMSERPPQTTRERDRPPTWLVALWLMLLTLVAGMAATGYMMWVVSRRF
jgi:hypothetical protein